MPSFPIDVPHFAVPFNITSEGAAMVEQDSDEDIMQCVEAICRTPRNSRLESPDFGIDEIVLRENGPDRNKLVNAITYWEPRARVAIDITSPDTMDAFYSIVEINIGGTV